MHDRRTRLTRVGGSFGEGMVPPTTKTRSGAARRFAQGTISTYAL
jgi:hypothetical protein